MTGTELSMLISGIAIGIAITNVIYVLMLSRWR